MIFFDTLRASKVQIRVTGACISACTLVLSLPRSQVCVTSTAKFGFHLATTDNTPDVAATDMLKKWFYPESVQAWIDRHGPLAEAPIYLSGDDLIDMGVFPRCQNE